MSESHFIANEPENQTSKQLPPLKELVYLFGIFEFSILRNRMGVLQEEAQERKEKREGEKQIRERRGGRENLERQ